MNKIDLNSKKAIHLLPAEVVDQIAAGEVVERPAHLIKELVENSIDAGATKLIIEVSEGGRRVKVADNGHGISKTDLNIVLDRFTTSKLETANDLWNLSTFGFRGEALASIASVSELTLVSRTNDTDQAWELRSIFGKRNDVIPVGGAPGTTILIEQLFGNTPARLKFMKTDAGEYAVVRTTLKGLALAHPSVEIRYIENGKLQYSWPPCGSSLERVKQVMQLDSMWLAEGRREDILVRVAFADPSTVAKSSKNIWIFVQNRWVQDRGIQAAVMEAYRNLLMHGEFPHVVIWIETHPEFVDVNIHPTKSQIKFQDSSLIFRATQSILREALEKAPWLKSSKSQGEDSRLLRDEKSELFKPSAAKAEIEVSREMGWKEFPQNLTFKGPEMEVHHWQSKQPIEIVRNLDLDTFDFKKKELENSVPAPLTKFASEYWSSFEVIGQLHKTYLICQSRDKMILVDQHAAHERVAFERIMSAWKGGRIEVQEFLFPLSIDLSPEKIELLTGHFEDLKKLGIHAEVLGPATLGIQAAPVLLKDKALVLGLEKMSQELNELGGSFSMEKVIGDICSTLACHSVVRAGQAMSLPEMKALLVSMDEFPLSSFCPHGRPVSVEFRIQQIEKEFGRIP